MSIAVSFKSYKRICRRVLLGLLGWVSKGWVFIQCLALFTDVNYSHEKMNMLLVNR
jgi:hypothetical protein